MRCSAITLLAALTSLSANAFAEPGPKPACQIEDPPAQCAGVWYASADALVNGTGIPYGQSDPVCGSNDNMNALNSVIKLLSARPDGSRFINASGDVLKFIRDTGIAQELANNTGGFLHDFILRNGAKAEFVNCATLGVFIPKDATIVAYRMRNVDIDAAPGPERVGGCSPGTDCSNGYSRFIFHPDLREEAGGRAVGTVFANWSHNRRRVGQFTVFFTMPAGKAVLPQW